ncbi:MAG TPA: ribosome small subunit-dependent GTPase A [Xanthomonadales bacterium]|nr:ribosome small subunit-dependent GTPase A [Xanthomonadales bacterium]
MLTLAADDAAALRSIGWRDAQVGDIPADTPQDRRVLRVVAQHRSGYKAHDGREELGVQAPARFSRGGADPLAKPAVGDWILAAPGPEPLIETVLPRRTLVARAAAGERYVEQAIAANVDTVFIVCGLDGDYNPRRIERYLVLIEGSGALPVVLLTKRDLVDESDSRVAEIERLAGALVPVFPVNAKSGETRELLAAFLGAGQTAVLVGSSGAGKSTLTNTLMGIEKMKTGDVRETDSRGRHTTTHRALLKLPSGGCLIDTPGMRELKLTAQNEVGEQTFADIEALAASCRFNDCRHASEPGCAVQSALASGALDAGRWANYQKLRDERDAARDTAAAKREKKAAEKVGNKALGKRLVEKYGKR